MAAAPSLHQAARCGDAAAAVDALARGASLAERNKARTASHIHAQLRLTRAALPRHSSAPRRCTTLRWRGRKPLCRCCSAAALTWTLSTPGAWRGSVCVRCLALSVRAVRSDNTALHCAALPASAAAGALLLAAGACACARDEDGDSPLHEACRWERVALARALLAAGADVDAANCCGWTPLHCAAAYGRTAAAALLLEAGADAEALTGEGRSAAQLAKSETLRALIQAHLDAESDADSDS